MLWPGCSTTGVEASTESLPNVHTSGPFAPPAGGVEATVAPATVMRFTSVNVQFAGSVSVSTTFCAAPPFAAFVAVSTHSNGSPA